MLVVCNPTLINSLFVTVFFIGGEHRHMSNMSRIMSEAELSKLAREEVNTFPIKIETESRKNVSVKQRTWFMVTNFQSDTSHSCVIIPILYL